MEIEISYLQVEPANSLCIYEHEEAGLQRGLKSAKVQPVLTWGTHQGMNDPVRSVVGWRESISVPVPEQEAENLSKGSQTPQSVLHSHLTVQRNSKP